MIAHPRSFLSAFFIVLSSSLFAQDFSISGKIVDSNGAPIELVNVIIEDGAQAESSFLTFIKGTATNQDGSFKIDGLRASTYKLTASFIGYEDFAQIIKLRGEVDLKTIVLQTTPESLDEVTIIAKKPTVDRKPDRLIFNVENTALIEGSTLGVLKSTPGVIVSEGSINIKSAPAAIFINNRKAQLTSEELIQLLESAPANSIKSVEVITNPPASYDADSGSVINIIMSKNLVTGYRGNIATNFTQGVFPRYNFVTSHFFKNDNINLNLTYSYNQNKINRDQDDTINFLDDSNNISEVWHSNTNRNTWSETHNLNLNFDYYINDNNTISLTSTGLYMPYFKYQIKNITNIFDDNNNFIRNFTADNLSRDNKLNIGTDLIYQHTFQNDASLVVNGHLTVYDYDRDQSVFQDEQVGNDSEFKTIANQDTQIITGKADYKLPIDESSSFDAGVKVSNVKTDSDILRLDIINGQEFPNTQNSDAFEYDENVFATYVNYAKSWDKWDLNIGLRTEQTNIEGRSLSLTESNTQNYFNWFPNTSLSYKIADDFSIDANYKRSITRPSYSDLNPFTFFLNENTVVLGNPNLVPIYRDHFYVGINFLKHFTVSAYYDNFDGDIVELPRQNNQTNIIAYTPVNLDKKVEYGFDFEFTYSPTNDWFLYFVTSFYNIEEESNFGEGFVKQDQWSNYSVLQNSLSLLEDKSLNINFIMTWVGKNLQQFQTIEDRLASELSISKSIFNKKGMISLSVNDIFNFQDFDSSINYLNQSSRSFVDVDNRFVRLGFRYNFGNTKLNTNERGTSEEGRDRLKDLN